MDHCRRLLLLLVIAILPAVATAKDYSVPLVTIDAWVRADGSILYEERRTYRFDGSFSEADYILSRNGFDQVRDIQVHEGDVAYLLDDSKRAGTYRVNEKRNSIEIVWNYIADDEDKTFVISYVMDGAVVRGPEHAEFFWTYLSDRWEKGTDSLVVNLRFDEAIEPEALHYFTRGADHKATVNVGADGYTVTGSGFSSNDSLELRAVFPATLVARAPVTHADFTLGQVLADEEQRERDAAERVARLQELAGIWRYAALVLGLLSAAFFGMLYHRFGQHRPVLEEDIPKYLYAPPTDHPPALASFIITPLQMDARPLVATLFDFCRRGYFRIVRGESKKSFFGGEKQRYLVEPGDVRPSPDELYPWEASTIRLIVDQIEKGDREVKAIFDMSTSKRQKWFSQWQKSVKRDVDALSIQHPKNARAVGANLLLQTPILLLSIPAMIYAGGFGALPLVISLGALMFTGLLRHRTPEGERLVRSWKAYRQALHRGDPEKFSDDVETHFAYATAFMLTEDRTETLLDHAPSHAFLWLVALDGRRISPTEIGSSVVTMASSVSSSVATGTGASVGMAGGGAGGGAR